MDTSYHGAAVLIALLPMLMLAIYLRRRGNTRPPHRGLAMAASPALLLAGAGVAVATGAF